MSLDTLEPAAAAARFRSRRAAREIPPASATSASAPTATSSMSRSRATSRHYIDDPYVEPGFTRAPLTDEVDVLIIGGGFGGLLAGGASARGRRRDASASSRRAAISAAPGTGTAIPGAQCDIESYIYLPLLEETGYIPKEKYSFAPEILRACAAHRRALRPLQRRPASRPRSATLRWNEDEKPMARSPPIATTTSRARYVVMSNGPLNRPKLPGIPGIDTFKGHSFHTSRWDYDYTGGDTDRGPDKLADKRVAIIGTGATAIQCVPHLGKAAEATLCLPAHAVVGRRARQQADRSRVGQVARAGWQKRADGELQHAGHRRHARTRIWSATAGPTSSATWARCAAARGDRR